MLKSARSKEFRTKEGREKAYLQIRGVGSDALVIIGGYGSLSLLAHSGMPASPD